jgi:hypothetical protein
MEFGSCGLFKIITMFIKSGWFPLIVNRDRWAEYIDALEKADRCDLI